MGHCYCLGGKEAKQTVLGEDCIQYLLVEHKLSLQVVLDVRHLSRVAAGGSSRVLKACTFP